MWICEMNNGDYAFIHEIIDDDTFVGMLSGDGDVKHDVVIKRCQLKEIPCIDNEADRWTQKAAYDCANKINYLEQLILGKKDRPREGFEPPRDG